MVGKLLVALCALTSPAIAQGEWQQGSSSHFVVYDNDTPEHVHTFTERLERFDKAIRAFHQAPEDQRGPSARVTVFILSDIDAIQKLAGNRNIAGFYDARAGESVAFVPRKSGEGAAYGFTSQAILFHEYTHHWMLTNWTDAALPPWYVEGAAELHATALFRSDGSVVFGAPPTYRGWTVGEMNVLPAAQLTRANPGKLDGRQRDALYSRGWLLADYMTFDPERRKQLGAYVAAVNSGRSAEEASALLGNISSLDLKLTSWAKRPSFPSISFTRDQLPIGAVTVRALTPAEAAIMPALIASKRGVTIATAPAVVRLARTVTAPFPNDAAAQNELAEAEYDVCSTDEKSDATCFARAEAAADRAIAIDPKSVHALIYKGMAELAAARRDKVTDPARWTAIRQMFLRANKADTEAPQPLIEFYRSFGAAKQKPTANAEAGLLYAYALAPYDAGVRMLATRVYLRQGNARAARIAIAPVAYNLDEPVQSARGQKILAALDKDGVAAALAEMNKPEEKKDSAKAG